MRNWILTAIFLIPAPLTAFEVQSGFEYWDLNFFSPSRSYRSSISKSYGRIGLTGEYQRTERFNFEDNTFTGSVSRKQRGWGWEAQASLTPSANVMFRHGETVTFYLPAWLKGFETYAGANFRRYNESRITGGFSGLRRYLPYSFDANLRGARNRTQLVNSPVPLQWSNAWAAEAGWAPKYFFRFYAWRAGWKEFFESGRASSGAFKSFENGAGIAWTPPRFSVRFMHAMEKRSTDSSIHKTSLSLGRVF